MFRPKLAYQKRTLNNNSQNNNNNLLNYKNTGPWFTDNNLKTWKTDIYRENK